MTHRRACWSHRLVPVVAAVAVATAAAGCGSSAKTAGPSTAHPTTSGPATSTSTPATTGATSTTLPAGPAPLSAFPAAVGQALAALAPHTSITVNGPTQVVTSNPLSAVLNSGDPTATTTTAKAGGYSVELYACSDGVAYPLGSPTITAKCDDATDNVGGFGALGMASEAAAAASLPGIAGPGPGPETACPAGSPTTTIDGVAVATCSDGAPKATWTTGGWTIAFHLNPGQDVASTVSPLVRRLATETLPPYTGWFDVDEGGDGAHTTAAWAEGPIVRTIYDYHSATGAADLVVSSRDLAS